MVVAPELETRKSTAERRGSESVGTKNFELLAGDTVIGQGEKTDPEIPVAKRQPASPLAEARMPAAPRNETKTAPQPKANPVTETRTEAAPKRAATSPAARPEPDSVARDYQKLATAEEQRAFKDLGKRHQRLEKALVALESSVMERKSGMLAAVTGVFSAIGDWYQLRSVKNEIAKVRREEGKLLGLVYERANTTDTRVIKINKDTPAILQRASIPVEKQGHMPRYLALVSALGAEVSQRTTAEKPLAIAHRDQVVVVSRKNEAGQTESMMFSYREDGKVSYYRRSGTDTEWKREATIWNDAANSIGLAFMKGKPFPRVVKPSEDQRRIIAPVEFDEDWKPAAERRVR